MIDSFPFPQLATVIEVNSLNYCLLIFTSMTLIKGMEKNQWCTVLSCQEPTTWLGTRAVARNLQKGVLDIGDCYKEGARLRARENFHNHAH